MNTPEPCDSCEYCKWDILSEDDPDTSAYCIADNFPTGVVLFFKVLYDRPKWGDMTCSRYLKVITSE